MDITREIYLRVRNEFIHGVLSDEGYQMIYEYWKANRKEEFLNPDYDEFKATFSNYALQGGFNNTINTLIPHYDVMFTVTTLTDKNGKILTCF